MIGKIVRAGLIVLLVVLLGVKFLPWGSGNYESELTGATLVVPKLATKEGECCEYAASFKSLRSVWSLEQEIEQILEDNYTEVKCLSEKPVYYDEEQDVTIHGYSAKIGFPFNQVIISYQKGRRC